jgi:hypothetical protein
VSAFAAAMAALTADPNLGVEALWQRGDDQTLPLRVLRSSPDQVASAFDSSVITATDMLSVPVAVLPSIERGDRFVLGADTLIVQSARRDATGTAWRVACQREA